MQQTLLISFAESVFWLYGLTKSVMPYRGSQFLYHLTQALTTITMAILCKFIGTKQAASSSYHPQNDGQTDRVNDVLSEMLRHSVNAQYKNGTSNYHMHFVTFLTTMQ